MSRLLSKLQRFKTKTVGCCCFYFYFLISIDRGLKFCHQGDFWGDIINVLGYNAKNQNRHAKKKLTLHLVFLALWKNVQPLNV